MTLQIRLFAILRERAERETIELRLEGQPTVADALAALDRSGPLAGLITRLPVRMAVNRQLASERTPLHPGDELALIPPLSGGAQPVDQALSSTRIENAAGMGGAIGTAGSNASGAGTCAPQQAAVQVRITQDELSVDAMRAAVTRPQAGALVLFCGLTREVERLEYEAYREMALTEMQLLAQRCVADHGLTAIAIEHRVGMVPLGHPSVIVAASAPHRGEAFAGARQAIDRIKERAPIWKREVCGQSARWVDGEPPR